MYKFRLDLTLMKFQGVLWSLGQIEQPQPKFVGSMTVSNADFFFAVLYVFRLDPTLVKFQAVVVGL